MPQAEPSIVNDIGKDDCKRKSQPHTRANQEKSDCQWIEERKRCPKHPRDASHAPVVPQNPVNPRD
jgi:hypothetical protein